jgi:hypothetical protein
MKTKTKLKFFFFFFLSIFLICSFLPNARGEPIPTNDTQIEYDWLNISLNDDNPDDRLKFYAGGYDLFEAERLATIEHGDGRYTFRLKAKFGFEFVAYTAATLLDIFPEAESTIQKYEFLKEGEFDFFAQLVGGNFRRYFTTFDHLDLGDTKNEHRYGVQIPINVDLNPDFHNFGGQEVGGLPIQSSDYVYQIKTVEVKDTSYGEIGEYRDVIVNQPKEEDKFVEIDVVKTEDNAPSKFYEIVGDRDLGAYRTTLETVQDVGEGQTELIDTTPKGTTFSNQKLGAYTFQEQILLRPRVEVSRYKIINRHTWFNWNNFWSFWYQVGDTVQDSSPEIPYVNQKAHIYNYYIKKQYQTNIIFECNVDVQNWEKYENSLNDPIFKQGNWLWSANKGGTDELVFVAEPSPFDQFIDGVLGFIGNLFGNIFAWLWPIFIIIAIVLIIYFIYRFRGKKERENSITIIK